MFEIDKEEAIDIDTEEDLFIANCRLKRRMKN